MIDLGRTAKTHANCGGAILLGITYGGREKYVVCEKCCAFRFNADDVPSGTDRELNGEAFSLGCTESPEAKMSENPFHKPTAHELKTWPGPFQAIWEGKKTYEVRKLDRAFRIGDALHLREFAPEDPLLDADIASGVETKPAVEGYTGREMRALVVYMTPGGNWGLPPDVCVMGIQVESRIEGGAEIMDFGKALQLLKNGGRVCRRGWNGRGMWLELQRPDALSKMTLPYIYMKTADDQLVPWLASQADVLAEDWEEVP